jgi:CheY-like chemotaxis protein
MPQRNDGECPGDRESLSGDARRSPRNPRRILMVDDTADTRDMYALYFRSRGFIVETVSDGRAAIDAAHRLHPDVIVIDVAMPDLDGIRATREIKQSPHTSTSRS